jgi:ubiquinone/menaquinone biosynthesis C-methylase UbiE
MPDERNSSEVEWPESPPPPEEQARAPVPDATAGAEAKAFYAGIFSRHATAYRRRLERLMSRGAAGGRAEVLAAVAARPGQHILDLACGPGTLTIPLARAVGGEGEVIGVDLADGMLDQARAAIAGGHLMIRFLKMDIEVLQFPSGTFDAVTCGHGLHLVPNLGKVLREARRVLKPNGRFAASVPAPAGDAATAEAALRAALDARLGPAAAPPESEATRAVVSDPARLQAACLAAGFREAKARRVEVEEPWPDPGAYVDASFGWWSIASRLEGLSEHVHALVRQEAVGAVTAVTGPGAFTVPNASVVVAATA